MRNWFAKKTSDTLKSWVFRKTILFLIGLEILNVISNKSLESATSINEKPWKLFSASSTSSIETTKKFVADYKKNVQDKALIDTFLLNLQREFRFEASKKWIEDAQPIITKISTIFDLFQKNKQSSFALIQKSHLITSAMEESWFGKNKSRYNQKGIYQIMPIAIADLNERYDLYRPFITPNIAHIFWYQDSISQSFFASLVYKKGDIFCYSDDGIAVVTDPEKNITLWMLYYLGIEHDILEGNLHSYKKEVVSWLEDNQSETGITEDFYHHIEKYTQAKGISYTYKEISALFSAIIHDKNMQRLFTIFARFNGHPDNQIYYGFKILLYEKTFHEAWDKALQDTTTSTIPL